MSCRGRTLFQFIYCCLLLAVAAHAGAIVPGPTLAQLDHKSWTPRDGAPDGIGALAQTTDGWLWLGTSYGLVRFDGTHFEPLQLAPPNRFPDNDVYKLQADPHGGLWIGWRLGGVSHYRDGAVRNWGTADGLPAGSIWGFALDRNGVWAAGLGGLTYFDGRSWQRMGPQQGFTAHKASGVSVMADGTVAVLSDQGLFLRESGAARFDGPLGQLDARQPLLQAQAGSGKGGPIYIVQRGGIRILDSLRDYARHGHPWIYRQQDERTGLMLVDHAGALWYDDLEGLHRNPDPLTAAAPPGKHHARDTQTFTVAQGLSNSLVEDMLEDRDGTIWIATRGGIDRFRATNFVRLDGPIHDWASMVAAGDTGVIASDGERAWRLDNAQKTHALPGHQGDALTLDSAGNLWVASATGLSRRPADGATIDETISLPQKVSPIGKLHAFARGADGSFWVSLIGGGALHRVGDKWERPALLPDGGHKTPLSLLADTGGRMWFGYMDGQVVQIDGAHVRTFGKNEGLAVGKVALLAELDGVVVAGGSDGLARFDGKHFVPVTAVPAEALRGVVSAVASPQGLWLNGAAGVVQLDRRALQGGGETRARIFDDSDGLLGRSGLLEVGTIARARDGRIWAATTRGVFWLDPAMLRPEALPGRPAILHADDDGRAYDPARALRLPPRPQRLTLRYASSSLDMPERIRFRYRLEGYDQAWQPAGSSTDAVYTGLPPGDYRFVVQAGNGAGEFGPISTPLPVHVEAAPVQTIWFRAGCVALVAWMLWAAYRYRLRRQAARLLALERTRHAERDRIARELHDTLLQSVQGLILRFDAVSAQLPPFDPLRANLDMALARAGAVVTEARERVQGLRASSAAPADLVAPITALVAFMRDETGRDFELDIGGTPAAVDADVADACCHIVGEALRNAHAHAGARRITVLLDFSRAAVMVRVVDDGKGMDAAIAASGVPGHWGIAGMRERAAGVGAELRIKSTPGMGTELVLTVFLRAGTPTQVFP